VGLEQDDLQHIKAQNNQRWVGNMNIGFTPVKQINANLMYGNFRNFTHVRTGFENINNITPYQYADTLDYTQISENMGLSLSITPNENEKVKRSIFLAANYQQATEQQSDNLNHSKNGFFNGMVGYNHTVVKQNLNLSSGVNFNRNKADSMKMVTIGPSVSVRKQFFDKKLNSSLSLSYNQSLINSKAQSEVYIVRAGIGYTIKEQHSFDFSAILANRHQIIKYTRSNDIALALTYRYNFKGKSFDFRKKPKK